MCFFFLLKNDDLYMFNDCTGSKYYKHPNFKIQFLHFLSSNILNPSCAHPLYYDICHMLLPFVHCMVLTTSSLWGLCSIFNPEPSKQLLMLKTKKRAWSSRESPWKSFHKKKEKESGVEDKKKLPHHNHAANWFSAVNLCSVFGQGNKQNGGTWNDISAHLSW